MATADVLIGSAVTAALFGAYLLGAFQGKSNKIAWRQFFASCTRSLSSKGFLWAIAFPVLWLANFYALVAHVRLALGRWPHFGETFDDRVISTHTQATWHLVGGLILSL